MNHQKEQAPTYLFALPYFADYRLPFFESLDQALDGTLVVLHPRRPLNSSQRVTRHRTSQFTSPVRNILGGFESQKGLVRNVARHRPAAVVVEASIRDLSYVRVLAWCRLNRVPVAIWGLGRYQRDRARIEHLLGSAMTLALVTLSNTVIGKGKQPAEFYKRFTRNHQKVTDAPNVSGAEEALSTLPITADQPSSPSKPLRVLFVGRLVPTKNLDVLLNALARVDGATAWRLDIVGDGPSLTSLNELAVKLGIHNQVSFHGNQHGDALTAHFSAADALVIPGKGGLVVPEALAAGLPVISGPVESAGDGTLAELLVDGHNAFIASDETIDGLRVAVERTIMASRSGDFTRMRLAARQSYQTHGGMAAMIAPFTRFLESSTDD